MGPSSSIWSQIDLAKCGNTEGIDSDGQIGLGRRYCYTNIEHQNQEGIQSQDVYYDDFPKTMSRGIVLPIPV